MLTVLLVLVIGAFLVCVASAAGKAPLWVSVLLLSVVELLRVLPVGK
jgi:hypothetical protein